MYVHLQFSMVAFGPSRDAVQHLLIPAIQDKTILEDNYNVMESMSVSLPLFHYYQFVNLNWIKTIYSIFNSCM